MGALVEFSTKYEEEFAGLEFNVNESIYEDHIEHEIFIDNLEDWECEGVHIPVSCVEDGISICDGIISLLGGLQSKQN